MAQISVAIATFNGERFLREQLRSLLAQSRQPAELVIVDDGSTDKTKAVVEHFATSAPFPVRLLENETQYGYRHNFVRAAGECQGELIAFCDQDDIWEPNKLAVMEPLFEDAAVLLAYHNAAIVGASGEPLGYLWGAGAGIKRLPPLSENPWRLAKGFTQVFRRDLLRYVAFHPASIDPYWPGEALAHDQWFLFIASVLGDIIRVSQPLARYRQHPGNEHGWKKRSRLEPRPHFLLDAGFIAAARNRAELLRLLLPQLEAAQYESVERGIAYYDELFHWLNQRCSIYETAGIGARARTVHALAKRRAYRSGPGAHGFGWTGLVMDVYAGLICGPRAKRLL